jgi:hypothetical protein
MRGRIPMRGVLALCLIVGAAVSLVHAQGGFELFWWTVDGGGGMASEGGPYGLSGTVGQPDAGDLSGGDYTLNGGFWNRTVVNTPPALDGLPDVVVDPATALPVTVDLWAYAADAESADDELAYALQGAPPPGAGASIDGNRWLTVDPSASWCGYADLTVRATDPEGLWDEDTMRAAVTWSCPGP